MKLKPDELAMLNGEEGKMRQEAMKFLVELGEVFGAEEFVDIDWAFAFCFGLINDIPEDKQPSFFNRSMLETAIAEDRCLKIPGIGSVTPIDLEQWKEYGCSEELYHQIMADYELERRMGLQFVGSCTPYTLVDMNRPALGAHIVSIESSAIPYFNSVLGARCERTGNAVLLSAITGKYPKMGFHLDENRYATIQVDVTVPLKGLTDFGRLGIFCGEIAGLAVPVITGISRITNPELIQFCAGISTGGGVSLFHIPGITAEFRTLEEALNGKEPKIRVSFGEKELADMKKRYPATDGEPVNTVMLGCPQMNIYQVEQAAKYLRGKKVAPNVNLMIMMASPTRKMAEEAGYYQELKAAGAQIIIDTCPMVWVGVPGPGYTYTHPEYTTGSFATDSVKCAAYAKSTLAAHKVLLGDTGSCLEAAVTGKWRQNA